MPDIYLYDDVPVLKNLLGIKDSDMLDIAEAGMSRANMMLLYESGFQDFSRQGYARYTAAYSSTSISGLGNTV